MTAERILIRIDTERQYKMESAARFAIDEYNRLSGYLQQIEREIPHDWKVRLIYGLMSENIVDQYVATLYTDQQARQRTAMREELKEELMEYVIHYVERDFTYVREKNGTAILEKNALDDIKELCSIYLTNPEAMDRYQRLEKWVQEGNELWNDLYPFNRQNPFGFNLTAPRENGGMVMNTYYINFGE